MIYRWKDGTHLPVAAQVAGEHIETLRSTHGVVTAPIILNDARDESSPLHRCFLWDDAKAAEKHRLTQARHLLERIVTVVTVDGGVPTETRAFVAIQVEDLPQRDFQPIQMVLDDPNGRQQIVNTALLELKRWVGKYSHIPELAGAVRTVKGVRLMGRGTATQGRAR